MLTSRRQKLLLMTTPPLLLLKAKHPRCTINELDTAVVNYLFRVDNVSQWPNLSSGTWYMLHDLRVAQPVA